MMSNFSFRRKENKEFKHIAHGLIPAATIAPKPAVPRTPPPRSPYPSPERPRSALAAAILSSSLTGRTIAIPPVRQRSLSESDCSRSETHVFEPYASTASHSREQYSLGGRPHLPLHGHLDKEFEDDEEKEDIEREALSEDLHIYQSLDRPRISPIYALPIKCKGAVQSEGGEETDDSAFRFSPQLTDEIDIHRGNVVKRLSSCSRSMASPDLTEGRTGRSTEAYQSGSRGKATVKKNFKSTRNGHLEASQAYREVLDVQKEMVKALTEQNQGLAAERRSLEERCTQQSLQLQRSHERLQQMEQELGKASTTRRPTAGEQAELVSLRQQAQELVDENDSLKMTVHRLSVELSRYQTQFRPLSRQESSRISGLPPKGSAPPWLLDIKYLSPLLLAYEDRLNDKDALLQLAEERLRKFREHVEEVVHENEKLHAELEKTGGITHKEWKQLQEQATLVLQENQVLIEQLEVQHAKAKDSHCRHHTEVSKVSKQLMLLEAEKHTLEGELEATQRKFNVLQAQHLQTCSNMENTVSWDEHCTIASKLKRQLEYEEGKKNCEVAELLARVSSLQTEKNNLVLEKSKLTADIRSMEADLELFRVASRKTKKKIGVLKQQMEDSMAKEMAAHHYLASVVALAEKTTLERDQLIYMVQKDQASALEQDKKGVLNTVVEGTLCLGKLQEKVKVYKKKAATSLGVLGRRLREQEEDFAGKAASYQREIHHLQRLLQDKQEALDRVLLHKRDIECELEVVWQAATTENQRIRKSLLDYNPVRDHQSLGLSHKASPTWTSQPLVEEFTLQLLPESSSPPPFASLQSTRSGLPGLQRSPMFESDSDQHPNNSSDESEKNGHDFYS